MENFKNVFKILLVIVVTTGIVYIVWAIFCFIFTGTFLGAIELREGLVIWVILDIGSIILHLTYLGDKGFFE